MTHRRVTVLLITSLLALAAASEARGDDDRAELKRRFRSRYPVLMRLVKAGKVGESYTGLAGAVKAAYLRDRVDPDDKKSLTVRAFLERENKDRRWLHRLLAEELETTPELIATRDAKRRFAQARPSDFLKPRNKGWVRKRDLPKDDF